MCQANAKILNLALAWPPTVGKAPAPGMACLYV